MRLLAQLSHFNALGSDVALNWAIASLFIYNVDTAQRISILSAASPKNESLTPYRPSTPLDVWCRTSLLRQSLDNMIVVSATACVILNRSESYRRRSALTLLPHFLILPLCPTQPTLLTVGMRLWIAFAPVRFTGPRTHVGE